mgnify:CR=1 FL=1
MVLYRKRVTKEGHIYFERIKPLNNKKSVNKCVVCNRILRTGKKYCYIHKKDKTSSKNKTTERKDKSLDKYF